MSNDHTTLKICAPCGAKQILLHSCCAPCSSAIVECLMDNGITPTIYFCNPNIYPLAEYEIRKNEAIRYAQSLNLAIVDDDYNHDDWLLQTKHLAHQPERSDRCMICFKYRLCRVARYASENGFSAFTTTLASSRWKDLNQIVAAGRFAASQFDNVQFWEQNWRKGGLSERRVAIIKEYGFYQQQYCGCEFSLHNVNNWRTQKGLPLITVAQQK